MQQNNTFMWRFGMSIYIAKKYTVQCTIQVKASYNSHCKYKDEALECFMVQHGNYLIEQFKGHEITFDVIEHEEVPDDKI